MSLGFGGVKIRLFRISSMLVLVRKANWVAQMLLAETRIWQ